MRSAYQTAARQHPSEPGSDSCQRVFNGRNIFPFARFVFCHVRPCGSQMSRLAAKNAAAHLVISVCIGGDLHVVSVTVFLDDKLDGPLIHCFKNLTFV